jgi:hypothetical protein
MFNHNVRQWYWTSVSTTLIKINIHIGNHKNEIRCLQLEPHFKNILQYFHFMFTRSIFLNFFFVALILMVTNTWCLSSIMVSRNTKDISCEVGTFVPKYVVKMSEWKTFYEILLCATDLQFNVSLVFGMQNVQQPADNMCIYFFDND